MDMDSIKWQMKSFWHKMFLEMIYQAPKIALFKTTTAKKKNTKLLIAKVARVPVDWFSLLKQNKSTVTGCGSSLILHLPLNVSVWKLLENPIAFYDFLII